MRNIYLAPMIFLMVLFSSSMSAQTNDDNLSNKAMSFELKNDTLYGSTGLKIFVGQKLVIGKAAGENGQYRSIIPKNAAIVPSIWGQNKRFENAIENHVDTRKGREKLRSLLIPGNSLIIKAIRFSTTAKPHFYMVLLSSDPDQCQADIKLALALGELVLQPSDSR